MIFGLIALVAEGRISPRTRLGQIYLGTMLVATVSAFGFIPSRGFDGPQFVTLLTLAFLFAGTFTLGGRLRSEGYFQTIVFSATYLELVVFAAGELLTRVPPEHPFATTPTDPAIRPVYVGLFLIFVIGVGFQMFKLRKTNEAIASPRP